jgi:hypothetical protein
MQMVIGQLLCKGDYPTPSDGGFSEENPAPGNISLVLTNQVGCRRCLPCLARVANKSQATAAVAVGRGGGRGNPTWSSSSGGGERLLSWRALPTCPQCSQYTYQATPGDNASTW